MYCRFSTYGVAVMWQKQDWLHWVRAVKNFPPSMCGVWASRHLVSSIWWDWIPICGWSRVNCSCLWVLQFEEIKVTNFVFRSKKTVWCIIFNIWRSSIFRLKKFQLAEEETLWNKIMLRALTPNGKTSNVPLLSINDSTLLW